MPESVAAVGEVIGTAVEGASAGEAAAGAATAAEGAAAAGETAGLVTAGEAAAGEIGTTAALGGAGAAGATAAETAGTLGLGGAGLALGGGAANPLTGLAATGANVPAAGNAVGGATTVGTGVPGSAPGGTPITGTGGTSAAATSGPAGANGTPVDLSQLSTAPISDTSSQSLPGLVSDAGGGAGGNIAPLSSDAVTAAANPTVTSATDTASLLNGSPGVYTGSSVNQLGQAVSQGNIVDIAGKAGNVITSNPSTALGALGLGYSALKAGQMPKGTNALTSQANALATQGSQLQQSLNGPLPAGAQASLNQASQSAKAQIRSQYANLGLIGSTMEAQALAGVDQTVAAQGFQIADQLYQQGVSETNMSSQLFQQIMSIQASQNNALTGAIGNFAGALAGSGLKSGG